MRSLNEAEQAHRFAMNLLCFMHEFAVSVDLSFSFFNA
jgi:hypothetical protein